MSARDVTKRFDHTDVLRGVSFDIGRAQKKVIIGPSGSGKSTLLRCLALLERADAGEIRLEGEEIGFKEQRGRRVHESRALAMRPKLMFFDEPTSALDPELVGEVLDVMESVAAEGMTMVVVTHELRFARRVADTMIMMDDGQVIEEAPPEQLFEAPGHERTRRFFSAIEAG
jgi:polar amino acid transport system ATP-binding protein